MWRLKLYVRGWGCSCAFWDTDFGQQNCNQNPTRKMMALSDFLWSSSMVSNLDWKIFILLYSNQWWVSLKTMFYHVWLGSGTFHLNRPKWNKQHRVKIISYHVRVNTHIYNIQKLHLTHRLTTTLYNPIFGKPEIRKLKELNLGIGSTRSFS